jgi:hypothetical protein
MRVTVLPYVTEFILASRSEFATSCSTFKVATIKEWDPVAKEMGEYSRK